MTPTCCTHPGIPCTVEAHEAAKRDPAIWSRLRLLGYSMGLEWRNCFAEGTLCVPVEEKEAA